MKKTIIISILLLLTFGIIHAQLSINYLKEVKISNIAIDRIRENLSEIN